MYRERSATHVSARSYSTHWHKLPLKVWRILLLVAALLACDFQAAIAQDNQLALSTVSSQPTQDVARISKEIILRLIELERFNLHYRLESDKQPKTRMFRFFAAHEANETLETAANIILAAEAGTGLNLKPVSKPAIRDAYVCAAVGNSLAGLGSFREFLSDMARDHRNRKTGFDSRGALKHMEKSVGEIDKLIEQRDQLLEQIRVSDTSELYDVLKEERHCLTDIRQHCLNEFIQFHQNMLGHRVNKDVFYLANTVTNGVFLAADCLFLNVFASDRNKKYQGAAQATFLSGTPLTMFSPYIAKYASTFAVYRAKKQIHKFLITEDAKTPDVEGHVAHSRELYSSLPAEKLTMLGPFLDRLDVYSKASTAAEKIMASEREHLLHLQKVAHESLVIAPILGSTQVARGVLETVGYYGYGRRVSPNNVRTDSALSLAATVTLIASNGFAAAYTGKNLVETVLYERRLHKKRQLVEDIIAERLDELDLIEKRARAL